MSGQTPGSGAPGHASGAPVLRARRFLPWITALLLLATIFWPAFPVLEIRGADGRILHRRSMRAGERFILRYTHSVARRPVEEIYTVSRGNRLILRETVYDSFGAGLPTEPVDGEEMVLDGPVIRITMMHRVFGELSLAVGGIARHELSFDDGSLPLLSLVPAGSSVRIRAVRRPLWLLVLVRLGLATNQLANMD